MHISRFLILLLLVSVCFAAQVPGNLRQDGNVYICVGPETVQTSWNNPFPRPSFSQNGISLTHIVPPPEFRAHDITVDVRGASLLGSLSRTPLEAISCQVIHSDGRRQFH